MLSSYQKWLRSIPRRLTWYLCKVYVNTLQTHSFTTSSLRSKPFSSWTAKSSWKNNLVATILVTLYSMTAATSGQWAVSMLHSQLLATKQSSAIADSSSIPSTIHKWPLSSLMERQQVSLKKNAAATLLMKCALRSLDKIQFDLYNFSLNYFNDNCSYILLY